MHNANTTATYSNKNNDHVWKQNIAKTIITNNIITITMTATAAIATATTVAALAAATAATATAATTTCCCCGSTELRDLRGL